MKYEKILLQQKIVIFFINIMLLLGLMQTSFAQPEQQVQLWEDITPKLEDLLRRQEQHEQLPKQTWFGEDKSSNITRINELLDQAVTILSDHAGPDHRARIAKLEQDINKIELQINTYRQQQISAPKEALWEKTSADYDTAVAAAETQIQQYRELIKQVKQEFASDLRQQGIDINTEQLDFLLATIIGEELLGINIAFDNFKTITQQLEQLLVASGESLPAARRYYGLYSVLLAVLAHMHQHVVSNISDYVADLDTIADKTHTLSVQSRKLKRQDTNHQQTLSANIEAQQLTLRATAVYRDYLEQQARQIIMSQQQLARDIAVAENTYETVKLSGELVHLIHNGQYLLDNLFSRQLPTLFTFQNLELKREFTKLTERLKAEQKL